MAKILRKNTLTTEKVKISDAYELFLGSQKTLCAEKTYKIYDDIVRRHIIPSLTSLTNGYMDVITAVVLHTSINDYADNHSNIGKLFYFRHLKAFISNWERIRWQAYMRTEGFVRAS